MGFVRQQLGEVLATVRGIENRQNERAQEEKEREARLNAALRDVKHDINQKLQVTSGRVELLEIQLSQQKLTLEQFMKEAKTETDDARSSIKVLQGSVDDLVTLRRRIGSMAVMIAALFGIVATIAQPLWNLVLRGVVVYLFPALK